MCWRVFRFASYSREEHKSYANTESHAKFGWRRAVWWCYSASERCELIIVSGAALKASLRYYRLSLISSEPHSGFGYRALRFILIMSNDKLWIPERPVFGRTKAYKWIRFFFLANTVGRIVRFSYDMMSVFFLW